MPFAISPSDKTDKGPFKVITQGTQKVHGTHPSWGAAVKQMRALYANVPDAKEAKETKENHTLAVLLHLDSSLDEIGEMIGGFGGPPSGATAVTSTTSGTTTANVGPYEKPFPFMLRRQVPEKLGGKKKKREKPEQP